MHKKFRSICRFAVHGAIRIADHRVCQILFEQGKQKIAVATATNPCDDFDKSITSRCNQFRQIFFSRNFHIAPFLQDMSTNFGTRILHHFTLNDSTAAHTPLSTTAWFGLRPRGIFLRNSPTPQSPDGRDTDALRTETDKHGRTTDGLRTDYGQITDLQRATHGRHTGLPTGGVRLSFAVRFLCVPATD